MKIVKKENVLKILTELMPTIRQRYKVNSIAIFGSVARGENRLDSDIDILVDFKKDADLFVLIGLTEFLELKLNNKIDIVSKNGLRKELSEIIYREAVPV